MCSRSCTIWKPSAVKARTTRRLGASTGNLGMCFGDESLQNARLGFEHFLAERFHMKPNGGLTVSQRFVVTLAFAADHAFQSQWIGDIAIRVSFDDNFDRFH